MGRHVQRNRAFESVGDSLRGSLPHLGVIYYLYLLVADITVLLLLDLHVALGHFCVGLSAHVRLVVEMGLRLILHNRVVDHDEPFRRVLEHSS